MFAHKIQLDDISFSNQSPIVLIGGINVIEDFGFTYEVAKYYKDICKKLKIPLVFKASYDKANRSSISSYRGPGIEDGIKVFEKLKDMLDIKILTDVHSEEEALKIQKTVDIIQLPAFLARQTDLIGAIAKTNKLVNIKKPQFISPYQTKNIIDKFKEFGNNKILLCERGTCFGYDNLIVDMLGIGVIKKNCDNVPIIFDVTHALQCRNSSDKASGGRRSQIVDLAKAGTALGLAGIFIESHPNPDKALCDGPSALPLDLLEQFLHQIKEIDTLVKKQSQIKIN